MIAFWEEHQSQAIQGISLKNLLGRSDVSAVYLADLDGQQCALKLVHADESEAQILLSRWQQASELSHPHLTRIYRWGRAQMDGQQLVYVAMEYAEEVLAEVGRPLTAKEARQMLTLAAQALTYLHSEGMVHGRIRPSNVLSVQEVLKIAGDAPRRMEEDAPGPTTLSLYDPPELKTSGFTPMGDVWSLGVTLVKALTKEPPAPEVDRPQLPAFADLQMLAEGCLQRESSLRWTIADVAGWLQDGKIPTKKQDRPRYWPWAAAAALATAGIGWQVVRIADEGRTSVLATNQKAIKPPTPASTVVSQAQSLPGSFPAPVAKTSEPKQRPAVEQANRQNGGRENAARVLTNLWMGSNVFCLRSPKRPGSRFMAGCRSWCAFKLTQVAPLLPRRSNPEHRASTSPISR